MCNKSSNRKLIIYIDFDGFLLQITKVFVTVRERLGGSWLKQIVGQE